MATARLIPVRPGRMRWAVLVVVTTAQVTASFATQGLAALTGALHDAFALSGATAGLVVSAVAAAPVVSLFVVGDLVDRYGERWVLAAGALVMAAGLAGAAAAPGYPVLLGALLIAGVGYSTVQPGGSKSISSWFPATQRGMAMGIRQAGLPIGGAVAAATLPVTAHALGWRAALLVAAAVALAGGLIFTVGYRPPPVGGDGAPGPAGTGAGDLLARLARTARSPWLRPILWSGLPLVGVQFALTAHLMLFTREHLHRPLSQGALLLVVLQSAGIAGRVGLATWSDHTRRLFVVWICMLVTAAGLVVLPVLPAGTPFGGLAAVIAVIGFFGVGWYGPWVAHIADAAPPAGVGRALGAAMAANQLAIIAAPPLTGLVHDLAGGYLAGWWTLAAITALASLAVAGDVRDGG